MAMPGWAIGLGAALKAPEVANDYMGLFKNVQAMRDEANASEELQRIQQFKTPEEARSYRTDSYLSPTSRQTLEKLRAEKLDALLKEGAAAPLSKIQDLQMDPRFRDPESVAEISRNPAEAVFGRETVSNPYVSQGIEKFQAANLSKLDRFSAAKGDRWAGAGLGKDDANAFKDVAAAQKDYAGMDEKAAATLAENALNGIVANYPLQRTTESWNGLVEKLRKVPNLDPKLIDATLTAIAGRNQAPAGAPLTQFVKNGPNSTRSTVNVDMFGEPIAATRVVSSNNPSDRELGITGGGGGDSSGGMVSVSWVGPDGTPQSASVPRGELSTLKSSLKAQGVKELNTVDGKKPSRTEILTKPEKGKRSILGDRPGGGAPAAKATGGFTYVNGKLVPN